MKNVIYFSFTIICLNCSGQKTNSSIFNSKYCFEKEAQELTVIFKTKQDTVFLYYYNIIDGGNYLNGFDEEDDYAGSFIIKEYKNDKVNFFIKSYRNPEEKYLLSISFNPTNGWVYWNINQKEPIGYLPKHATLKKCN